LLAANKPDLFLLKTYDDKKSVVGWVMSEKFDGIR
jgi:DNA ligase-1